METVDPCEGLERTLHEEEEINWVVEPSRKAMALSTVVKSPAGLFLGLFVAPFTGIGTFLVTRSQETALYGGAVGLVIPPFLIAFSSLAVFLTDIQYGATDERILKYKSLLGETYDSILLEDIRDSEFNAGLLGSIFGVGTVDIDTSIHSEGEKLEYVREPSSLVREINSLADSYGERGDQEI